jgi:hypothetical protein
VDGRFAATSAELPGLFQHLDYAFPRPAGGSQTEVDTILREIALLLPTGVWSPLQHLRRDLVDAAINAAEAPN